MKSFQLLKLLALSVFFFLSTSRILAQDINDCYKANKVADKVWAIVESAGTPVNIYVVEGKDSALIIDTGYGKGDLKTYVKTLTKLPLIVVNTHGHGDHSGNDSQFSKIYAHAGDFDMINASFKREKRLKTVLPGEIVAPPALASIKDGYVFNLGGRKLEVIEVPGHTHGSICLLDSKNKILFAGDNTNTIVWLFLRDCYPLEVYLKSLQKVEKRISEFNTIMPGHNEPLDKSFLIDQIGCVKSILAGTCSSVHYDNPSNTNGALICKYGAAQVAYSPTNLFIKK